MRVGHIQGVNASGTHVICQCKWNTCKMTMWVEHIQDVNASGTHARCLKIAQGSRSRAGTKSFGGQGQVPDYPTGTPVVVRLVKDNPKPDEPCIVRDYLARVSHMVTLSSSILVDTLGYRRLDGYAILTSHWFLYYILLMGLNPTWYTTSLLLK